MKAGVKQRDITDCGAACLAFIGSWYGFNMPVARIRQLAGTDKKGTNVLGLVEALGKMGFIAKGVRGEWESLFKIPKPAVAHVIIDGKLHHYVVITSVTEKRIEVMDPAHGQIRRISHDDFRKTWTGVLVILTPGERFKPGKETASKGSRFYQLIKPNSAILIQALAGALLYSILGLSMSLYLGKLVDNVLPGGNLNLLNMLGVVMLVIILLRLILSIFQALFVMKTGQKIDATLILGYYQHILKLPQNFFDNMRTGEIISRISDAVKIRVFINDVSIGLILNVFILIVSFALMFTFYFRLAIVMLISVPLYAGMYILSDNLNRKIQRRIMEKAADLEAQLVESLNSAGTIKRFGLEDYSNLKTEMRFVSLLEVLYKSGINGILSSGGSSLITQVFSLVVLWSGSVYVMGNHITSGELLAFYSVVGYFTGPVSGIIGFNRTLQDANIAADRLFEIFDLVTEQEEPKIELSPEKVSDIVFENVSFRYGTRTEVFNGFNLTLKKGEITAVIGESGSGKTTLISLLQNLYEINEGHIRIGGFDIRHYSNASIRRVISVVPQRIDLFATSLAENIAIGDFCPDMDKIEAVCKRLGLERFVEELPNGLSTMIGENGSNLSGGQRQKIAIARAIYRDPEILILDEATSSLDPESEEYVRYIINVLKQEGKTIIVIAHRLSTINMADRIVVLGHGRLLQEGTPAELKGREGHYKNIQTNSGVEFSEPVILNRQENESI